MVNIALNYGFIENFTKGDRFARRRAKSCDKERNIYVYNEIKSASFVKALDANNAAKPMSCPLRVNSRGALAVPAALGAVVNDIKN